MSKEDSQVEWIRERLYSRGPWGKYSCMHDFPKYEKSHAYNLNAVDSPGEYSE